MCGDPARGEPVVTLVRDRYEVLATVGSGGEAQVVKAMDRQHGRLVALKIRPVRDEAAREDLLGEARVLLSLPPHPALPLVREDFFDRGDYVVAMDWVEGTDLAALLRDRGRPGLAPSSVLTYLAQAAEALTHLHSQSPPVIHGDVKPGNLILTSGGRIKLVDFGLSSAPSVPRVRAGTPGYRAPELATGVMPSRASDIYALAATAFALLTGSAPAGVLPVWAGFDPAQAEQLEAAIRLGMATDPARRPQTPGELVERLRAGWSTALPTGVVTFCCSDIEDSSALWETDPEAMAEALVRHDELIADAVEARAGSLIKSAGGGDSTISVFDSAPAAVEAALAANRSLAAEDWPPGIRIAARWGIHTGEAERRHADYHGPSVNLAVRVRSAADGDEILLSSATSELVAAHLPEGCSLVDLGPHRFTGVATPERIHALTGPGLRTPPSATESPYRGLLAFEPDDRAFFFGREAVVAELIERVEPGRLLAVVGASGSGKSSVLRAGLLAAARAGEVAGIDDAVLLTPGAEPRLAVPDEPTRLVVVDQFEELFTVCADADLRERFIDALLRLRCAVAIGMRADLYGRLGGHAELARAIAASQLLLAAMTADELGRAVTEPARLAGLKLEPGLVELVLRDVAAEPGALPLLSHALRSTWERRDGRTLTVDGYRETGGVASALARTADAVVDGLPGEQQPLARSVFLRMTELGEGSADSRRRVTVEELVPEGASPDTVRALLGRLADARLVTLDGAAAEVAHEALIRAWPRLRRWLDEDRAVIRAHRQLSDAARVWDAGGREASDLYRGARLAGALELAQSGRAELNATERAFLDNSVAEAERERRAEQRVNRRLRGLLAVGAVLLVAAVAGAALSLVSRSNARTAESAAQAQALTSDAERVGALAQTAPTIEQSMLYAAAAVNLEDRVETRANLLAALQRNPAAIRVLRLTRTSIAALVVSPDGRLLASGDERGVVRFTDLRTWKPIGAPVRLQRAVALQAMDFSPDGRTVAVGTRQSRRSELHVIDVTTGGQRRIGSWGGLGPENDGQTTSLAYSPDGRRLAVGLPTVDQGGSYAGQRLLLLDARSGRRLWRRHYPFRRGQWAAQVMFRSDGALISSAQQGKTLVWDASAGRIVRRYPIGGRFDLSPDGRRLALALNEGGGEAGDPSSSVGLLDLRTGRHRKLAFYLPEEWIVTLAFTRDGEQIVGAASKATHVWDVASGELRETYATTHARGAGAVLDRRGLVLDANYDGSLRVWDPGGARRIGRRFVFAPGKGCWSNPCAVVDPRGAVMAAALGDGTIALIDLRTKRTIAVLPARNGRLSEPMAFTPDGRRLVTGGIAGTVTIWDVRSRAVVRRLRFSGPVAAVAVSRGGRLLAIQRQGPKGRESRVEVRDLRSGRTVRTHRLRFGVGLFGAGQLAFTPDGRVLVSSDCCRGREGSRAVGWDVRSGAPLFDVPATAFAPSPDSQVIAAGSDDGYVTFVDAHSGTRRGPATKVAGATLAQLSFSPDGQLLAVAAWDATATVWHLRSRSRLGDAFPVANGLIPAVAFEPGGRLLITELGSALEWPLDRPTLQRFACQVAGRDLTRAQWHEILPNRPYRPVCPAPGTRAQHDAHG
jgi:WD40 repeat protein/class 3 adenylate cyclase/tRNA A-37 threonylcarbamoyl transferase component Bud32